MPTHMKNYQSVSVILLAFLLTGCIGVPKGITPVSPFELERYKGEWYEIARLDHVFERDMESITAEYSSREDGGVKVLNKGFHVPSQEWREAEGRAYFVDDENEAHLKVSFFGPFFGSYIVFELGENYDYAYITSRDKKYLWWLARSPDVSEESKQEFIRKTKELGFETEGLIFVNHQ